MMAERAAHAQFVHSTNIYQEAKHYVPGTEVALVGRDNKHDK